MYKRFVRESSELEPLRAQCAAAGARGDPEIDNLWARIDERLRRGATPTPTPAEAAALKRRQWATVRVFISSTFKDFFAERESLVKRVFPSLRDWCERRRIALYDYDLRWGVPKDSTGSDAVRTCLELLDRCLAETGGRAFFLGLVGDRFGWVPAPADLEPELQRRYDWTFGSSVTQMEVVHGAVAGRSPNALFMVRDSACYKDLPDAMRKDFVEPPGSVTGRHVARQKLELAARFPPNQVRLYAPKFAGTVREGKRERVQFAGLEDFEQRVLAFFQRAIAAEFPQHDAPAGAPASDTAGAEEPQSGVDENESNETHVGFMFSLAANAQGQAACQRLLTRYAEADNPADLPPLFGDLDDGAAAPGLKALAVTGDPGAGKTTALARLGQQFADRTGCALFAHFAQFSPASGNPEVLRRKLATFFKAFLPASAAVALKKEATIQEILEPVAGLGTRFLLIIDALESFFESYSPSDLLPPAWPANVRCVLSCNQADLNRCFAQSAVHLHQLEPLDPEARLAVCRGYLDEFGKRLDAAQLAALLNKASAANPLWLTQACEELRVFGDYSAVSQTIAGFPDETLDLMKAIGARLLKDNVDGTAAALLSLVGVSRAGLWEKHARRLMRFAMRRCLGQGGSDEPADSEVDGGDADEVPLVDYLRARRETRVFLRSVARDTLCIAFQHWMSLAAVRHLLLDEPEVSGRWHSATADFIQDNGRDDPALLRDLPHHLYMSDRRSELHRILVNDSSARHMGLRFPFITASQVYNTWRCRYSKVTPATKQATLAVCTFCKNLPTRTGALRSSACAFCGLMLTHGNSTPAITCTMHQAQLPSLLRCWFCGRTDPTAAPLSLCGMCSNMASPVWCCQPVLETDRLFQGVARSQHKRSGLMW